MIDPRDGAGSAFAPDIDRRHAGLHVLLFSYELGPTGHTGGFRWDGLIRELVQRGFSFDVVTSADSEAARTGLADGGYGRSVRVHPVSARWAGRNARRWLSARRENQDGTPGGGSSSSDPVVERADAERPLRTRAVQAAWGGYETFDGLIWARRAGRVGTGLTVERRPDAVVATLPEWLVPLAARHAAEACGAPLVLDLRDPWMFGRGAFASMIDDVRRRAWRRAEIVATRDAALVIDNTERARIAAQREIMPYADTPRVAITNAHPDQPPASEPDPDLFTVSFVGWLYPFMDPRPLLRACGRLRTRHGLGSDDMAVRFVGTGAEFGGASLSAMADEAGLSGMFKAEGRVPRPQAAAVMAASSVLAILDFPHGLQTPSKFYHYAQMKGVILPIAAPGSALADAAASLGIEAPSPGDHAALDRVLDGAFAIWRDRAFPLTNDPEGLYRWPRVAGSVERSLRSAAARPVRGPRDRSKR